MSGYFEQVKIVLGLVCTSLLTGCLALLMGIRFGEKPEPNPVQYIETICVSRYDIHEHLGKKNWRFSHRKKDGTYDFEDKFCFKEKK